MAFIFKGNLRGFLCDECFEAVSNAQIRIYSPEAERDITAAAVAATKDTLRSLTEAQVQAKSKRLIAEGTTDQAGNFEISIGGNYSGGAFDIDFYCGNVPRFPPKPKLDFKGRQFHLTTLFPQWKQVDGGLMDRDISASDYVFGWQYSLPTKLWCFIRGFYFDAWTICGHLLNCETKQPLAGLTVVAMDADFLTDDRIGSAVTDSSGHFRIDYSSADFKQTFLSPWINIETDINLPFASGPDVYFQIEYGTTKIPFENAANRRNNVGYCLCVELCMKDNIPDTTVPASFTHIGRAGRHHITTGISTTTGKTLSSDAAFYSSLVLIGSLNKKLNNQPMEYMFEYQEVGAPSATPPSSGTWLPVKPNMIAETNIGYSFFLTGNPINPVVTTQYYVNKAPSTVGVDVVLNGNWIQMPQAGNFVPHTDTDILYLKSEALTGIATIDMAGMTIGLPTVNVARPHVPNRYIALRMKQREISSSSVGIVAGTSLPIALFNVRYDNVKKFGTWAPQTVNGQLAAVSMDILEIVSGVLGCNKIISDLHVKYNARHENLGSVQLKMYGPGQDPDTTPNFAPIALATPEVAGSVSPTVSVAGLASCAYTVKLTTTLKLTNGEGNPGPIEDFISFCKS